MAIAYGAGTNSGVIAATNTTTFSSPSVSGSNTLGIVGAFSRDAASTSDIDISSITWNGVAMTSILHREYPNTAFLGVDLYYIIGPTAGVTNVVTTWAGAIDTGGAFAAYITGAAQSSPVDVSDGANNDAASNTDPTTTFTTTADNCILFDSWFNKSGTDLVVNASQTSITQLGVNAGGDRAGGSYRIVGAAGSYTMTWAANPDDDWVHIAAAIKSFSVASSSHYLGLLGIGA